MKYLSRSDKISLQNNICIQVVIDALKEFDKEAMARLVEWLIKQPTFDNGLLAPCLQAFHDRHAQQLPINFYALEQLVKFYSRRSWNQIKNERGIAMLPVNHPLIISTMVILIRSEPNNNRIGALVEWMMEQQEYDLTTFTEWVRIFKEREQNNPKVSHNLDYPLLHKILSNFKVKWGQKPMEALHLEAGVANYLKGKGII